MAGGLRYETGRDMPPGMQELAADKLVQQLKNTVPVAGHTNIGGITMENYIIINNQRIDLTEEQVAQILAANRQASVQLASVAVGGTVKIGGHELVVLEHMDGTTALIRKDLLDDSQFGECNNYAGSYADEACNEFAGEISTAVGEDNMILFSVDLTSDDGLKDYGQIERRVALLTTEQYRKYVEILDLHKPDGWWWLATPHSTAAHGNDRWVKCVSPSGYFNFNNYINYDNGVRPFCILKSNIFVSN